MTDGERMVPVVGDEIHLGGGKFGKVTEVLSNLDFPEGVHAVLACKKHLVAVQYGGVWYAVEYPVDIVESTNKEESHDGA